MDSAASMKLDTFFRSSDYTDREKELALAEAVMCFHTICHNHSFRSMDCNSKLLSKLFDKKFSCARTKTELVVKNVLSKYAHQELLQELSNISFVSIFSDASNKKDLKLFPTVVRYFTYQEGVKLRMIDLVSLPGETSELISESIMTIIANTHLSDKIVGFCADNANTNFGGLSRSGKNNVFSRLDSNLKQSLVGVGCSAHIIHNAIQTAADLLPLDVENIITKIYAHFYINTVRVEKLKEFCSDVGVEYNRMLGFCKTRWLALLPAIERVLKMYEPLKSYFLSIDKCPIVLQTIFEDPSSELWLMFFHNQSSMFHKTILAIEGDKNTIMEVSGQIFDLISKLEERLAADFISTPVKQILNNLTESGQIDKQRFMLHVQNFLQKLSAVFREMDISVQIRQRLSMGLSKNSH